MIVPWTWHGNVRRPPTLGLERILGTFTPTGHTNCSAFSIQDSYTSSPNQACALTSCNQDRSRYSSTRIRSIVHKDAEHDCRFIQQAIALTHFHGLVEMSPVLSTVIRHQMIDTFGSGHRVLRPPRFGLLLACLRDTSNVGYHRALVKRSL